MLGHYFRIRASNTQSQAITVTVKARYWKYDSNGALSWSTEQTLISAVSVSATTGTTASGTINNSSDLWVGADLTVEMTAAAATTGSGSLAITLERSTDAGTTWPTQDLGVYIGAHTLLAADSTNARRKNYTVR